jgi:hypothetical protein
MNNKFGMKIILFFCVFVSFTDSFASLKLVKKHEKNENLLCQLPPEIWHYGIIPQVSFLDLLSWRATSQGNLNLLRNFIVENLYNNHVYEMSRNLNVQKEFSPMNVIHFLTKLGLVLDKSRMLKKVPLDCNLMFSKERIEGLQLEYRNPVRRYNKLDDNQDEKLICWPWAEIEYILCDVKNFGLVVMNNHISSNLDEYSYLFDSEMRYFWPSVIKDYKKNMTCRLDDVVFNNTELVWDYFAINRITPLSDQRIHPFLSLFDYQIKTNYKLQTISQEIVQKISFIEGEISLINQQNNVKEKTLLFVDKKAVETEQARESFFEFLKNAPKKIKKIVFIDSWKKILEKIFKNNEPMLISFITEYSNYVLSRKSSEQIAVVDCYNMPIDALAAKLCVQGKLINIRG